MPNFLYLHHLLPLTYNNQCVRLKSLCMSQPRIFKVTHISIYLVGLFLLSFDCSSGGRRTKSSKLEAKKDAVWKENMPIGV